MPTIKSSVDLRNGYNEYPLGILLQTVGTLLIAKALQGRKIVYLLV